MIYLDNNATTRPFEEVRDTMLAYLSAEWGNPSSAYDLGKRLRAVIYDARASVAELVGASQPSEIVFTSGGTESDNWAILGALAASDGRAEIVTTRVEHEAVRKLCERLEREGRRVTWLDVDRDGAVDLGRLKEALTERTAVVSIMLANNETGVIFPVAEIAELVMANSNAVFHIDAVNAAGKIPLDATTSGVDLLSLSAHKFHGPKGVGALYIRDGLALPAMAVGGGQEFGRRAGTEAVHQIAGMGTAARICRDLSSMELVRSLRDRLETGILNSITETSVNGSRDPAKRLPNTTNISFANTNGEAILARLDAAGICVSTGSACNSETHTASPVLEAMNVPYSEAMGSIRFSLGRFNNEQEIDHVLAVLPTIVAELRSFGG